MTITELVRSMKQITRICTILALLNVGLGNELGSLIEGIAPKEEIKLDGDILVPNSEKVTIERKDDGKLSVSFKGKSEVSVSRSTGLSSGSAQELLDIIRKSIGSRYQLIASIKRGGRYLTLKDESRLNEIIDSNKQEVEIFINDKLVDLSKAALIESNQNALVLKPQDYQGVTINLVGDEVIVKTSDDSYEVKIVTSRGLSKKQIRKLKDNFYEMVAERVSNVTGLPKTLIEISLAGRNTMVGRLTQVLGPVEQVFIGGKEVNLDKAKRTESSSGITLEPENFPKVKIIRKRDGKLQVDSEDSSSVNIEYSKGVEQRLIGKLVDGLHRALTLRLGLISWSNKLIGSIPYQLETAIEELKIQIQKRTIYVDNDKVDLKKASVKETSDESVLYNLPSGVNLRVYMDGTISTEGGESISIEVTPGISETQAAYILSRVNQMSSTAITFSTESGESLLNDDSNRKMIQSLLRGIKINENIKIDDKPVDFAKDKISQMKPDYTDYTVDDMDDVILTKYTNGDIKAEGKSRAVSISRGTGLSLDFLNRLVTAINDVMPRKRWLYDFNFKGNKNMSKKRKLRTIIGEIPSMTQEQTVFVNNKKIDIKYASILSSDETSTVYSPETNSKVKITKFKNGEIEAKTESDEIIAVKVSRGISVKDADTLVSNIKNIVGDRVKIDSKWSENTWCFPGDMGDMLGMLLKGVSPRSSIIVNDRDITANVKSSSSRDVNSKNDHINWTVGDFNGRGKIITSPIGGKLTMSLSTGLTQDLVRDLMEYLSELIGNKEDVIKMVTGSLSDNKIKKIKSMIQNMIQDNYVSIDSVDMTLSKSLDSTMRSNYKYETQDKIGIVIKNDSDGNVQLESSKNHEISIAIGPGLTLDQGKQLYKNIKEAFKMKFSEITHIPVKLLDVMTGFKKYFIKSYFFSAAPPKEMISINDIEIPLGNVSISDIDNILEEKEINSVSVSLQDGTMEVTSSGEITIDLMRTTGLDDQKINRILAAIEYKLGIKNKMFTVESDELVSEQPERRSVENVVRSFIVTDKIIVNGKEVDASRAHNFANHEDCSQFKSRDNEVTVKRCNNGHVTVKYKGNGQIKVQLTPGISEEQANHIIKSISNTIKTKSSNIKILSNFPDTFFQLLSDGRIKSLERLLMVLTPKENLEVDGQHVKLEPLELKPKEEHKLIEPKVHPGVQIIRYSNGNMYVKSLKGGKLNLIMNTGLSRNLIKIMMDLLKDQTTESLSPYLMIVDNLLNTDVETIINILDSILRQYQDSNIDVSSIMNMVFEEISRKINSVGSEQKLIITSIIQKQQVYIMNQPLNIEEAKVIEINDDYTTYSPVDKNYIKITRFENGRLIIDSQREEPISLMITAGIPPKLLSSLIEAVQRLTKKMDTESHFITRIKEQMIFYLQTLFDIATDGIEQRHKIAIDNEELVLIDEAKIKDSEDVKTYKINDVTVIVNTSSGTTVRTSGHTKIELDLSSGLESKPVVYYLRNNSISLLRELLQSFNSFETLAPLTSKVEKIIDDMYDFVKQSIYINQESIESNAFKLIEKSPDFKLLISNDSSIKITHFNNGTLIVERDKSIDDITVHISNGLPVSDLERLSLNMEHIFSRFNPIEVVADIFDILPKNFFILAQNMDRVMSVMNLIKL